MVKSGPLTVLLLGPGGSVHTRRWAAALDAAGHRVVVASWQGGPPLAAGELRVAPSGVRRLSAPAWLRRLVREVRPDVVHVHSLGAHGVLALALPAGPRAPALVITPWGSELRAAIRIRPTARAAVRIRSVARAAARAAVIRLAVGRADLVLPTSAEVAEEMVGRYGVSRERIRVLSWGVAAELFSVPVPAPAAARASVRARFGIPADATVVLSIRSATASYRVHEVVSAFGRASAVRADLFLVVLGGHLPSSVPARRAAGAYLGRIAGVGRMVIVDRTLSQLEAFRLMAAADVAVSVPAADQRSSSVLEAALAGCHLLLSDIAPYREMVRDGLAADLLAEPVTDSLAEALRRVRPDQADQLANQAFIRAHEHGADKAAALEQIYREVSASRAAARGR